MIKNRNIFLTIIIILYAVLPLISRQDIIHIMTMTGIWIIIAFGLNILTGYMGYVSFGHAGFVGIGAYASALLTLRLGLPVSSCIVLASLITALIGLALGLGILRLTGIYFSIATLLVGSILYEVFYNWSPVTGGFMGLNVEGLSLRIPQLIDMPFSKVHWYYLVYLLVFLIAIGMNWLIESHFGKELIAIRENESLSESLGVKVNLRKSQCLAIACLLAGLGGALFAHYFGHVDPDSFSGERSVEFLTIVIIGGLASLIGPFFGAYIMIALSLQMEVLGKWRMIVIGIIMVLIMLYAKGGIAGVLEKLLKTELRK